MERDDAGAKAGAVDFGGGLLGHGHRVQRTQRAIYLAHHEAVEIDFGGAGTADPSQHVILFVDVDQRQKCGVLAVRHLQAPVHFTAPGVAGCAGLLGIAFGNAHLVMLPPSATYIATIVNINTQQLVRNWPVQFQSEPFTKHACADAAQTQRRPNCTPRYPRKKPTSRLEQLFRILTCPIPKISTTKLLKIRTGDTSRLRKTHKNRTQNATDHHRGMV
jgi:hypothetical protein